MEGLNELLKMISEKFGGGGHPKASGFTIKDEIITCFIKNILNK